MPGYSAGYFSYKWAEVLSADAFSAFEEAGLDDEAAVALTGRRFRDTVLASGGGRAPMEVFKVRLNSRSPWSIYRVWGLKIHLGLCQADFKVFSQPFVRFLTQ
jgi:oligopeptidase A